MPSQYEPKDHIQHLETAPRAEGILDQREITIQSYQATVPFDYKTLNAGLDSAWLTPQIRFGVFSRISMGSMDALNVVLGLQDELWVRAYDYDERRPLWFSWQDIIVDTVGIHYFRDEEGLLRFTTTGGGRRITDDRLHDFNSAFLRIPKDAVSKRHFDLAKLRGLCFDRFVDRLYMLRFADPSGEEYRSIDHALFQSRQYIDPDAERLHEIRADPQVKIESFDSDVTVCSDELASPIQVRFFIRGLSGSLRLRFPKISYRNQLTSSEEQARVFYQLVDASVRSILDSDYYTQQQRALDDLGTDLGLFPDLVDLAPFREVLTNAEARKEFIWSIDVGAPWQEWNPHLRALDELLLSDVVSGHATELIGDLARRDPRMATRLLAICRKDPGLHRVGALTACVVAGEVQTIPAEIRAHVEETLLSWAIDQEEDTWDVDPDTGEIGVLNLRWQIEDLAFDALPAVIWKLAGILHARLIAATEDTGELLRKFNWCMKVAEALPAHHAKIPAALRLVAIGQVPQSAADSAKVIRNPVSDLQALDDAVLAQFGLPLWPFLTASQSGSKLVLSNEGIGAALAVRALREGDQVSDNGAGRVVDLASGEAVSLPSPGSTTALDVRFEKFGRQYCVALPVVLDVRTSNAAGNVRALPSAVNRARHTAQRNYRKEIDPQGIVVGSSPALLEVFEGIHHANAMDGCPPVLILGEPGVGKTHIAKLLHESSDRASGPFRAVNAGGGGGDINIQRGEWIGYGKGHGIQGIDRNGQTGHIMAAEGGTLFVDEFAALSPDLQVIFLSVLERRPIEKIGGESFTPDVRCVLATNADLEKAVEEGRIRRDLLDRIPVRLHIPPLRERRGDILLLARHFAPDQKAADRCLAALLHCPWPGNVRELRNTIAAAVARNKSDGASAIGLAHIDLPAEVLSMVEALDEDACRRELWTLADEIARDEGFAHGTGLQRRAGEIMGVGEAQASKMYQAHGLAGAATA